MGLKLLNTRFMEKKCHINGCDNELGFIESGFGIKYCEECEKLLVAAKLEKIDVFLCKNKKDLIELLKNKTKN